MEWSERLKTKIKVGERYVMRNGSTWTVSEKIDENYFLIKKNNIKEEYIDFSIHKELIIGILGNFGNYPNQFDLVMRVF